MSDYIPQGFMFSGTHAGIKQDATREDMSLVVSQRNCVAAGVYTQNQVVAAPVILNRQRTPAADIRAVVTNSGNANACTGQQGLNNAAEMARLAASGLDVDPQQVLVLSTGIIGSQLPMDKIAAGVQQMVSAQGRDPAFVTQAARGMMTTDTRPKTASRSWQTGAGELGILGLAKGAAMIGPSMATMLAVLVTDAALDLDTAQAQLTAAVDDSFNCISVEGHTSTNDTVLLLANGAAGGTPLTGDELESFAAALRDVCIQLAQEIPNDGEGATHLIEITVSDCRTREDAVRVAKAIANSPLVKTAVAGADPNWGRIVSAAGYSGVLFDPATVELTLNGTRLYRQGTPLPFDAAAVSASIARDRTTQIHFSLGQGEQSIRFWTCDLTSEYVHLNADYHT